MSIPPHTPFVFSTLVHYFTKTKLDLFWERMFPIQYKAAESA